MPHIFERVMDSDYFVAEKDFFEETGTPVSCYTIKKSSPRTSTISLFLESDPAKVSHVLLSKQ